MTKDPLLYLLELYAEQEGLQVSEVIFKEKNNEKI